MTDNKDKKETKGKDVDSTIIKPNEIFSYLGKKYVKKHCFLKKFDDEGRPVMRKKYFTDGSVQTIGQENCTHPIVEFYGIVEVKTDSPKVLKKWGRPLTTQIKEYGPIDSWDLFKYEDENIIYDNLEFRSQVLIRKGNKIIKRKEEESHGRKVAESNEN